MAAPPQTQTRTARATAPSETVGVIVRYEDEHVKLTDTALILKSYNSNNNQNQNQNQDEILFLTQIDRVCWSGNNIQPKETGYVKTLWKQKTHRMRTSFRWQKKKTTPRTTNTTLPKKYKRFVVVATSPTTGQPTGYGVVVDDPVTFQKLLGHFVTAGSSSGLLQRSGSSAALHHALVRVTSHDNLLPRIASTDHVFRPGTTVSPNTENTTTSLLRRVISHDDLVPILSSTVPATEHFIRRVTHHNNNNNETKNPVVVSSTESLFLRRVTSTETLLQQTQQQLPLEW